MNSQFNNIRELFKEQELISENFFNFPILCQDDYFMSQITAYTSLQSDFDSLIFESVNAPRLVDLEKDVMQFEKKYNMDSKTFYNFWKTNPSYDKIEFNKWAKLIEYLKYGRQEYAATAAQR